MAHPLSVVASVRFSMPVSLQTLWLTWRNVNMPSGTGPASSSSACKGRHTIHEAGEASSLWLLEGLPPHLRRPQTV